MTRIAFVGLLVGCLLHGAALAQSGEPYVETTTGFIFPAQIGKFHRVAVTELPDKQLGVAIRYEGQGRAEVFIYDLGFAGIPTGIYSAAVKKAFAESEAAFERLLNSKPASNGKKFLESTPVVRTDSREAKLVVALYIWTFTASDGRGGPMATYILVTGVKNKILKLLYTAQAPEPMSTQAELQELVAGFLDANPKQRDSFFIEKKAP